MKNSSSQNTIVVPDVLPGLGVAVRFLVRPYVLCVPNASGTSTKHSLRLFLPEFENGRPHFIDAIATRLVAAHMYVPASAYFHCQRWVSAIFFQDTKSHVDPRRRRTFLLSSLSASKRSSGKRRKYDTFDELRQQPEFRDLTNMELLLKMAGISAESTTDLIEQAIFLKPAIEMEESFKQLLNFDHDVKGQLRQLHELITDVNRALGNEATVGSKQSKPLQFTRGILFEVFGLSLASPKPKRRGQKPPHKPDIEAVDLSAERENASKHFARSEEHLSQCDEMIAQVRRHLQPIAKDLGEESLLALRSDERLAIVDERLGTDTANALLATIVDVYERRGKVRKRKPSDDFRVARLKEAIENSDRFQKWCEIISCTQYMLFAREYGRLCMRNAIRMYHLLLGYVFVRAYRGLREQMTAAEKRAFLLMYLPHPDLGHLVPALDPVLCGFWKGMSKQTRDLLLHVVAFRLKDRQGDLESRWRAYLKAFPSWAEIVQDEDRSAKRRKGKSLETPVLGKDGSVRVRRDLVRDEKAADVDSEIMFQSYLDKYCSPKQRERVIKCFCEGKTHQEIGAEEGVSQAAVTKSINSVLRRIAEDMMQHPEW